MRTLINYHFCLLLCLSSADAAPAVTAGAQPGESFTFKFSVGAMQAGRARMSVGVPTEKNGRRLLRVHAQAEALPWLHPLNMDDDYQLLLDADTLLPVEVVSIERGVRERRFDTTVAGRRVDIALTSKKESGKVRRQMPDDVRDPLSALFAVRAAPLSDGDQLTMLIVDGLALWKCRLTVHTEKLRLEDESHARAAVRLDGENQRVDDAGKPAAQPMRHFTVWLSDDNERVLLRMEADTELGRAALTLTSYQSSAASAAASSSAAASPHKTPPLPRLPGLQLPR